MKFPANPVGRLAHRFGLEPGEGLRLLLMGTLVAVLYCAYTVAKVVRDALFLGEFGALSLPYAYVAVALASAALVWLELRWARRFTAVGGTRFTQYLAIACSVAAALAYPFAHRWTTAFFYVWTGSQAMMLLPHFWVLALDIWDSRRARRVFPLLAGCGLLGGLAGGAFAGWTSPLVQRIGLMWTLPFFLLGASEITRHLESARTARPRARDAAASAWAIIRGSPYIMVLVVTLALSVIVGTLVDFQFKVLIQQRYPDPHALTQFLGRFYVGLNALSLLFQFGAAGWLMQRLGLGVSTGLQPAAVVALASWAAVAPGMGVIIAMRWIQGVLSQTLGKSSSEIYYTAIRPNVRRRIKPPIDTLVERWSDAAVGVLLAVALHLLHVRVAAIAIVTAALTAGWIVMLFVLDRQYGRAFEKVLSDRWIEPEDASDALRLPAARRALIEAVHVKDENRIVMALQLCGEVKDARIERAVRECLAHESPAVRAAAVDAMSALELADPERRIVALLSEPDDGLRRAAVRYLVVHGPHTVEFTRRLLEGDDDLLKAQVVETLFDLPCAARAALTPAWIEGRLATNRLEDQLLAARGLGAIEGASPVLQLRLLFGHADPEVRRVALRSAIRRPSGELLGDLLPLLVAPGLHEEARMAIAAVGNPAVRCLEPLLEGSQGSVAQSLAANTLAQLGSHRAVQVLIRLARDTDVRLRHLGLRGLIRVRVRKDRPVLARDVAHRFFLRELRDYRDCVTASRAVEHHAAPEIRLLADSYRDSADTALERALQALGCWYDPEPLIGVLARLRSRDRLVASPALEYLDHVLPHATFASVRKLFEAAAVAGDKAAPTAQVLADVLTAAWRSADSWLRACAVRGSRCAPGFDTRLFTRSPEDDPLVRAEIAALAGTGGEADAALSQGAAC